MEQYYPILEKCALFRRINGVEFGQLMRCLGAQVKNHKEEEYVFLYGDVVNYIGIVLTRVVEIMKESLAGGKHILAFLEPSDMFAEGIVCTADVFHR